MKILALDGNSILNRAFYGISPLTTKTGLQTQAVFGFLRIMDKLQRTENSDVVCVAFDLKAPTFRHKMYPEYKATRRPMPHELIVQIPYLKKILDAMGIARFEVEGFEADDILGTFAAQAEASQNMLTIVTGDKDSLQLLSNYVRVCFVKNKGAIDVYDTDVFKEEYGFPPINLIDLKALMGDKSDNIPGIKGIGESIASDFIRRLRTIDTVYERIDTCTRAGVKQKLIDGKDMAYLSYELAKINKNVPVELPTKSGVIDKDALYDLFAELEFHSFIKSYGLKKSAREILAENAEQADDLMCYLLNPTDKRAYTKEDAERLLKEQGMWKLYTECELPLVSVLREMEQTGFKVDAEALETFGKALKRDATLFSVDIFTIAGGEFNLNSPKQMGNVLFNKMKIEPPPFAKKTKSGYSTSADMLEKIDHPIAKQIIEYRKLVKLKSTYVDGLLPLVDENGRLHTTFNQTSTATGRLSSSEPNLQNIPVRGEVGAELRKYFIAAEGCKLVGADYSQIELRILAHLANDTAMISAFESGVDIHTETAAKVFNVKIEDVTKEQRRKAKAVNFGIVYGISDFSLGQDIGVSKDEAKQYINSYFEHYSGVKAYMEKVVAEARENGYCVSLFGRRRYLPELKSSNFNLRGFGERVARNMPIQGTAADIIKIAMIKVAERLKAEGLTAKLIMQVHDELIVEAPIAEAEKVAQILTEEMQSAAELKVPLVADAHIADNWFELK